MKQQFKVGMIASVFTLIGFFSFSQEGKQSVPKWVSEKGYWVIENNIHDPWNHIIRFYTNDDELMYKETISGVKLNPEKRKVRMKLKKVLETSAIAWEKKKMAEEEKQYVMAILK